MNEPELIQGRVIGALEIGAIGELIRANPGWSRWRISRELCALWNWCDGAGAPKDMAARSLLVKLAQRGLIELPARRQSPTNRMRCTVTEAVGSEVRPLNSGLRGLGPLRLDEISAQRPARQELGGVLRAHHYLGYGGPVGQNLQYTVTVRRTRSAARGRTRMGSMSNG